MGFLSFLGVVLACPSCFLGLLGFPAFLVRSAPVVGVGWRVAGGSGVRGLARLFPALLLVGGGFGGASARVRFLVVRFWLWSGSVVGFGVCVLPGSRGGGRVAPGFFCCLLWWGFSGVVFSVRCFSCLLVLRCLVLCWVVVSAGLGVVGGVGLGWGCFFSGFCCTGPGLFGFGLGFVWRV